MKEENNTEKKEFPKDIDYVNPYVGLDKIYEKDPYKNLADGSKKKKTKQPAEKQKPEKNRKSGWILGIVLGIMLGVGGYLFISGNGSELLNQRLQTGKTANTVKQGTESDCSVRTNSDTGTNSDARADSDAGTNRNACTGLAFSSYG